MRIFGGMDNALSGSVVALPEDCVRHHTQEALAIIRRRASTVYFAVRDPSPLDQPLVIPILIVNPPGRSSRC